MMRGQLKTIMINMLSKKPMSGTELAAEIQEELGWKPSYGSIYPALDQLAKEGIIEQCPAENKKEYKLTRKGKQELKKKSEEKKFMIESLENTYRMLNSIYGIPIESEMEIVEEVKKGNISFIEVQEETTALKKEMFRLMKENKIKKNKAKIKKILVETTTKLRQI